jgi:hypothetical protein
LELPSPDTKIYKFPCFSSFPTRHFFRPGCRRPKYISGSIKVLRAKLNALLPDHEFGSVSISSRLVIPVLILLRHSFKGATSTSALFFRAPFPTFCGKMAILQKVRQYRRQALRSMNNFCPFIQLQLGGGCPWVASLHFVLRIPYIK